MTDLITELKALKEKIDGNLHALPGSDCIMVDTDLVARFDKNAPAPQKRLVAALVNHLPTILAKLEEGERMREAIRWANGERGEWPERKPGEGAFYWRKEMMRIAALESTHDH